MTEGYYTHIYDITPVPAPRMTRRDKWLTGEKRRPCVQRYFDYRDELQRAEVFFNNFCQVKFILPMPKSWSKKKKTHMDGKPHIVRPDIDNLLKALLDGIYGEDCHIYAIGGAIKVWGEKGQLVIQQPKEGQKAVVNCIDSALRVVGAL